MASKNGEIFQSEYIYDYERQLSNGKMYLDLERCKWWQEHQRSNGRFLTWDAFKKALIERFDHDSNFLGRLTKLRQTGTVDEYITAFETLAFRTMGLQDDFYMECFISGLKEAIQAHV